MIQAVIFDMDGTLIDSEPMWKEAEELVFSAVGVDVNEALSAKTASMTTDEVTRFWYSHFPWTGKSLKQVENEVVECVESLISEKGVPMEGVNEILELFHKNNLKIGLSTNSPHRLIPVVLQKLGISEYFQAIYSSEHEENGKPHPAVYLSTVKKLQVKPEKCIAFEDSLSGILAAKEANIKTVAVPSRLEFAHSKFDVSHLKLESLLAFKDTHLEMLANKA